MYEVLEYIAVGFNFIYIALISYKKISGWLFGILASVISVFIMLEAQFNSEAFLMGFYALAGVYGWIIWKQDENKESKIQKWPFQNHLITILVSVALSWLLYLILGSIEGSQKPLLDAHTTGFSIVATYLVAKKVLHNWIYWIIIDAVTTFMYFDRGLDIYAAQMFIFTALAVYGLWQWQKIYKAQ